jgi:hypothetical protein
LIDLGVPFSRLCDGHAAGGPGPSDGFLSR